MPPVKSVLSIPHRPTRPPKKFVPPRPIKKPGEGIATPSKPAVSSSSKTPVLYQPEANPPQETNIKNAPNTVTLLSEDGVPQSIPLPLQQTQPSEPHNQAASEPSGKDKAKESSQRPSTQISSHHSSIQKGHPSKTLMDEVENEEEESDMSKGEQDSSQKLDQMWPAMQPDSQLSQPYQSQSQSQSHSQAIFKSQAVPHDLDLLSQHSQVTGPRSTIGVGKNGSDVLDFTSQRRVNNTSGGIITNEATETLNADMPLASAKELVPATQNTTSMDEDQPMNQGQDQESNDGRRDGSNQSEESDDGGDGDDGEHEQVINSLSQLSLQETPLPTARKSIKTILAQKRPERNSKRKRTPSPADDDSDEDMEETRSSVKRKMWYTSSRRDFGRFTYNIDVLKMSTGPIDASAKMWPQKGPNTVVGRLQEIACEKCNGRSVHLPHSPHYRVHWSCAGYDGDSLPEEDEWFCPPCAARSVSSDSQPAAAPKDRCIRPDCILRAKKAPESNPGDEALYLLERIVGQKCIEKEDIFEAKYLIKWETWEMCDSTWEPEEHIPFLEKHYDRFREQAEAEGRVIVDEGVTLLQEAEKQWDEQGRLKGSRSDRWKKYNWPVGEGASEED